MLLGDDDCGEDMTPLLYLDFIAYGLAEEQRSESARQEISLYNQLDESMEQFMIYFEGDLIPRDWLYGSDVEVAVPFQK